jgi:hypothetical protein
MPVSSAHSSIMTGVKKVKQRESNIAFSEINHNPQYLLV